MLINPLLGNVETDKIKTLAITGEERSSLSPDVPTFKELGYPKYDVDVYYGIVGPSSMPADVVDKLNRRVGSVLRDSATVEKLTKQRGVVLREKTADEFRHFFE